MSSNASSNLPIVCLITGDFYGRADIYLRRLYYMLARCCPVPFTLHCFSDRLRIAPAKVELHACVDWTKTTDSTMRPTTKKLQFFDSNTIPFDEFLYLDISLIIQRDMSDLLEFAFSCPQDLVIINDWNYPCYNSSVMRIRRGTFQSIYNAFAQGKRYPQRVLGDQDFIHSHIAALGWQERVAFFPAEQIVSYKKLRALDLTDSNAAQSAIERATIVKFHGSPKMHSVANPLSNFAYRLNNCFSKSGQCNGDFFARELRQHWRDK